MVGITSRVRSVPNVLLFESGATGSATWYPLPAATQWEIAEEEAEVIRPARDELIRQAANREVLHNDNTRMRVLKLERRTRRPEDGCLHQRHRFHGSTHVTRPWPK
jgi:hypothetical protein